MGTSVGPRSACFLVLASTGTVATGEAPERPVRVSICRHGRDASTIRAGGGSFPVMPTFANGTTGPG